MIRACAVTDLPEGEARRLDGPVPIAVFHTEAGFFAVDDTCTHQDASLADGWLEGCFVECPLHAARFDLRTGAPTCLPAKKAVRTHRVVVEDGVVFVDAPVPAVTP
ncbi:MULTISPECIES: bifunctional 3-phenylpropionate/cinnamic acid dioxygenase ferredoxin subunit [unclassified Amycolatopsis]|uniref:bifunctional 3-phenylpropionate/cinnamic acid dioxygenase ferredoxin subunit n=1 Tax=unclassified Amycolatopsis TaxID=2618356 RepID=UPI002E0E64A9|nr:MULTISPECIES: bifunctional 3-phenylpropionate/cinnamic acid dioxygenase ferredoxin subunit [unclassified Amycolatopsis]WSJ73882.1 bifunctional 3-phenylpropionate/cinnamic acid dioxygenase ferredoxin subunit [Amycolatopsis sp. NBC_01307]WSK82462.1 bifunctional 3-phenylpropionate/cinnamic acid dioxygenase ferredoxin subunit [Amycolatopsis sp. NBC_01286]